MARHKRKQQPHDPAKGQAERDARALQAMLDAKVRERDPSRWGEERPSKDRIASLNAQGVDVELDFRGRVKSATKMDVWAQMHAQAVKVAANAGRTASLTDEQYAAVRRLEGDMIARMGHGAAGWNLDRYDRQGDGAAITDRMVDAANRVDDALALVGPPSCRILQALVGPNASDGDWREIVERITGETNAMAQSAALRLAAQSLADVYPMVEERERVRRDATTYRAAVA